MNHIRYTGIDPTDPEKKRSIGPMVILGIGTFEVDEVKEVDEDAYRKLMGTGEPFFERSNKGDYEKYLRKKEAAEKKAEIEPINTAVVEPVADEPKKGKK